MARQIGTLKLSSNIEPRVAAPFDAREKVSLKADLTAANTFPYPYEGMEVYVVEEKKKYILIGNDPTVSANWSEVGSGGGGSDEVIVDVEELPSKNYIENKIYRINNEEITQYLHGEATVQETCDWYLNNYGEYFQIDSSRSSSTNIYLVPKDNTYIIGWNGETLMTHWAICDYIQIQEYETTKVKTTYDGKDIVDGSEKAFTIITNQTYDDNKRRMKLSLITDSDYYIGDLTRQGLNKILKDSDTIIQLEELPERWDGSEIEENAIYQYIGETYRGVTYSGEHWDYKNGYFYKATRVPNIQYILWEELYGTKNWSELDYSVKRNYIPSIEFKGTLPDSNFDVEIQKDGTYIIKSKRGTAQDNILYWEGTSIPAGEYILCTELLSGSMPSGCTMFISVKNATTSESTLTEISKNISYPFVAGGSLIVNEGDTIQFKIYANGYFSWESTFKFHALFQQFSIVDRSWQPADMLDNIELSNKIPDTSKMINVFTGTQAEWDALTTTEKLTYQQVNITDDESIIGHIKSKTFSGTSDNNGFLLIDDDFDANKVVVLGVFYPSGTPPYRAVPIVSTNGNKWFLNVSDLLTGESLSNITITNATVYYMEI